MSKSRWVLLVTICFAVGTFTTGILDLKINLYFLLWFILLIALLIVTFWREQLVRIPLFAAIVFIAGIYYPLFLSTDRLISLDGSPIVLVFEEIRRQLIWRINEVLPQTYASLALGLLIGEKSLLSKDLKDAFITTGTIHLIAVSGFNITLVIKLFSDWLKPAGRTVSFVLGALAIVSFIILVGGQASVVRAGIMGFLFIFARFLFRPYHIANALFIAGFFMLLFEPSIIYKDIGFQLSFAAMLGLLYISPLLKFLLEDKKFTRLIPKVLLATLIETLAAQLAVFPLLLGHFAQLSLISPLPNLLLVPIIIFPMILSIIVGASAFVWYKLALLAALPLYYCIEYMLFVIRLFAKVPYAAIQFESVSWWVVAVIYVVLFWGCYYMYQRFEIKQI